MTQHFTGTVRGTTISGSLRASGISDVDIAGTLAGAPAPAAWAEMANGCGRFYGK